MSCVTPLGKAPWKLVPGFLQTVLHAPFSFADFVLYLLTVINLSSEYDYMLCPVSPPSESNKPGEVKVLGTSDTPI